MPIEAKPGPDLVIAGAARSGTSSLAARLAHHPRIDPGALKEPNFYSRQDHRGPDWYDGLYRPRAAGLLRMDASVSYTYPQYPGALPAVAAATADPLIVYLVRDPVARAVSHYLYYRYYFHQEPAETFGAALATNPVYAGASDYEAWIAKLHSLFGAERVLVVPFRAATEAGAEVAERICDLLGLDPMPDAGAAAAAHQNNVVTFRHPGLRWASRRLRRSRFYPTVRDKLGAGRLRRLRALATQQPRLPDVADVLATVDDAQSAQLRDLERRGDAAIRRALAAQDPRLGVSWARHWTTPDAVPQAQR